MIPRTITKRIDVKDFIKEARKISKIPYKRTGEKDKRTILSEMFNISKPSVTRLLRSNGISLFNPTYGNKIRNQVYNYYLGHTLEQTQDRFKDIRVRSIIERYYRKRYPKNKAVDGFILFKRIVKIAKDQTSVRRARSEYTLKKIPKLKTKYLSGIPFDSAKIICNCKKYNKLANGYRIVDYKDVLRKIKPEYKKTFVEDVIKLCIKMNKLLDSSKINKAVDKNQG